MKALRGSVSCRSVIAQGDDSFARSLESAEMSASGEGLIAYYDVFRALSMRQNKALVAFGVRQSAAMMTYFLSFCFGDEAQKTEHLRD